MQRTWLKRWPPPSCVHWFDAPEGAEGADLADQARTLIESAKIELMHDRLGSPRIFTKTPINILFVISDGAFAAALRPR